MNAPHPYAAMTTLRLPVVHAVRKALAAGATFGTVMHPTASELAESLRNDSPEGRLTCYAVGYDYDVTRGAK